MLRCFWDLNDLIDVFYYFIKNHITILTGNIIHVPIGYTNYNMIVYLLYNILYSETMIN